MTMHCSFELNQGPRSLGCQFGVPDDELIELDGKAWCPFHLPMKVGAIESEKARWDHSKIEAFNDTIFARIEDATRLQRRVDLSGVVFPGSVSFEPKKSDMSEASFKKSRFTKDTSFARIRFAQGVNFDGSTFEGSAGFTVSAFGESAIFAAVRFEGSSDFERASFDSFAIFDKVFFARNTNFSHTIFAVGAHFWNSIFAMNAEFFRTLFYSDAGFRNAVFQHGANFFGASFGYSADFFGASFHGQAIFGGDPDSDGSRERGDTFHGPVIFRQARFSGRAIFTNRRFLTSADFRGASFDVAPEFHNGVLHQDTRFDGTQFRDRKGTEQVDAASAYRTLKLAMESLRARDEEARFYAYEQQSLRARVDTGYLTKLFSWLYEVTSNYGQSLALPVFWLGFTFFVFLLAYAMAGGASLWGDGERVLWFTLQQVFQPFGVFRVRISAIEDAMQQYPLWLGLLSALQSLMILAELALFLLAVRRRFKLD